LTDSISVAVAPPLTMDQVFFSDQQGGISFADGVGDYVLRFDDVLVQDSHPDFNTANLGPVRAWLGLKNSDDQGTAFDLRSELLKNGTVVASGLERCITGLTRNPSFAAEATVTWEPFPPFATATGDVLSVRLLTRIGTNADDSRCTGPGRSHSSATGIRFYYDSSNRSSGFGAALSQLSTQNLYLRSNGTTCGNSASAGVTSLFLDTTSPSAPVAKCKDSASVQFSNGNAWKEIGAWNLAPLQ
jgi:hypothetical protein